MINLVKLVFALFHSAISGQYFDKITFKMICDVKSYQTVHLCRLIRAESLMMAYSSYLAWLSTEHTSKTDPYFLKCMSHVSKGTLSHEVASKSHMS